MADGRSHTMTPRLASIPQCNWRRQSRRSAATTPARRVQASGCPVHTGDETLRVDLIGGMPVPQFARPLLVMVGTSRITKGGISSVVRSYEAAGLFDRWNVEYVESHCDGSVVRKGAKFACALARHARLLVRRPSLVHLHLASRGSFLRKIFFAVSSVWASVPYIVHLHGAEFDAFFERECGPVGRALVRWMFHRAARVIALSDSWKRWIEVACPGSRVVVLRNPVAIDNPPATGDRAADVLLSLGRLGERKGTFELVEALGRLQSRGIRARLWLGGDGDIGRVRAAAVAAGVVDSVEFLGWVDGAEKADRLSRATVFALPSRHEGQPISVLEAMGAGLPVVSTVVGGIPDAVRDGIDGFLVDVGDVGALTDRLERLLCDTCLAQTMGANGRKRALERFSTSAVLPLVDRLYADVAGGR